MSLLGLRMLLLRGLDRVTIREMFYVSKWKYLTSRWLTREDLWRDFGKNISSRMDWKKVLFKFR